jgi:hypothetical protein
VLAEQDSFLLLLDRLFIALAAAAAALIRLTQARPLAQVVTVVAVQAA